MYYFFNIFLKITRGIKLKAFQHSENKWRLDEEVIIYN